MDFEVSPGELRRGGGDLVAMAGEVDGDGAAAHRAVPVGAGPGWVVTAAGSAAAVAAQRRLAVLAERCHELGTALQAASDAYEAADERAARRLRW